MESQGTRKGNLKFVDNCLRACFVGKLFWKEGAKWEGGGKGEGSSTALRREGFGRGGGGKMPPALEPSAERVDTEVVDGA